ncbi:MAG TPA: DEAD/DEAH box helicase, partial [Candidatus Absconditabacterales bacterium]|nr:DEAD/DEAH box helicase [Candidatus Absconditabacterales bacterium]
MKFTELGLQPRLLKALDSLGYHDATPIQQQVIESFTNGSHIVGQSQTGTGKTAAFVLPIVNTIDPKVKHVQTLVLVPTRELAVQVREEFFNLSKGLIGFRSVAVYGGSRMDRQVEEINKGAQVIVGTPGRVIDMIERGRIKTGSINYFIMDEVDRMLDMGFVDDVEYIRSKIPKLKQVMSFSATITPELRGILHKHIGDNYTSIKIAQEVVVDKVDHSFMDAPHFKKFELLAKYLREHKDQKVVIFTQTKLMTDDLTQTLRKEGFDALALHGDIRQRERMQTIKKLKDN